MKWRKLGLLFCPKSEKIWLNSYAAIPIAEYVKDDIFKIYFSSRDIKNRSYTGYLTLDLRHPAKIITVCDAPVLQPGELGAFDDSGAMATWLTNYKENKYLYYIGWNLGVTVPFRNSIGIAKEIAENIFEKCFQGPIVDRNYLEPHFCASCCVLVDNHETWRMWYLSCVNWEIINGSLSHRYHIKYAESSDGVNWKRNGTIAIDFSDKNEYAISRPCVLHDPDCWRMWYSYRGEYYRIGYAESLDGINWDRKDHLAGIDVSPSGWDSEMIEYPFVFDHKGNRYMLYNGNGYGKTGFGLAVLEQD